MTVVCGYDSEFRDMNGEQDLVALFGVALHSVDVGRDRDGEVRSFVVPTKTNTRAQSRNESHHPDSPVASESRCEVASVTRQSLTATVTGRLIERIQTSRQHLRIVPRARVVWIAGLGAAGLVLLIVTAIPSANDSPRQKIDSVPSVSPPDGNAGSAQANVENNVTDPQARAVDLALSGSIDGLGSMQGVSRSAISTTIASRAGDIVLIEMTVSKPSGLTTFATVLLQKSGNQWRMRQIVDQRN